MDIRRGVFFCARSAHTQTPLVAVCFRPRITQKQHMSKAFTRETDDDDDDEVSLPAIPAGTKNYITPAGYRRLKDEYMHLLDVERPARLRPCAPARGTPRAKQAV